MAYGRSVRLSTTFDDAVTRTKEALAGQGFGVLTEIDIKATLHKKLGVDVDEQLILGACNPGLAHRGLQAEASLGLLLPCNVVVRRDGDEIVVEALDPQVMVGVTGNDDLKPVADEAARLLSAALESLS